MTLGPVTRSWLTGTLIVESVLRRPVSRCSSIKNGESSCWNRYKADQQGRYLKKTSCRYDSLRSNAQDATVTDVRCRVVFSVAYSMSVKQRDFHSTTIGVNKFFYDSLRRRRRHFYRLRYHNRGSLHLAKGRSRYSGARTT